MAEWQIEEGIGEHRAVLIGSNGCLAAKVHWPGSLTAGQVEDAVLIRKNTGANRGLARFVSGEEATVKNLDPSTSEGRTIRLKVTRASIREVGRNKLAQAELTSEPLKASPSLRDRLNGRVVREIDRESWATVFSLATEGIDYFSGGSITITITPAMTLIDVDGELPASQLALAAVKPIANVIAKLDLAGSIGIDFPSLAKKSDRQAVDHALEEALSHWQHERTRMNGFGFVQLISKLENPSLLHRVQLFPASAEARFLLQRAQYLKGPGPVEVLANPLVIENIRDGWSDEFFKRYGRVLRFRPNPQIAFFGGNVQNVEV